MTTFFTVVGIITITLFLMPYIMMLLIGISAIVVLAIRKLKALIGGAS